MAGLQSCNCWNNELWQVPTHMFSELSWSERSCREAWSSTVVGRRLTDWSLSGILMLFYQGCDLALWQPCLTKRVDRFYHEQHIEDYPNSLWCVGKSLGVLLQLLGLSCTSIPSRFSEKECALNVGLWIAGICIMITVCQPCGSCQGCSQVFII